MCLQHIEKYIERKNKVNQRTIKSKRKRRKIVVLDADLSGATKTNIFAKKFPDRFIDVGIAEQNMFGIAAGLSTLDVYKRQG